jgi:hypothetical protein
MCPLSLAVGETSGGSSASVCSEKASGTFQMKTLPSSDADAISESLKGLQSVSRTAAVCPRKSGIWSGARPFSLMGMTANAPPPLDSQLTAMYSGLACVV